MEKCKNRARRIMFWPGMNKQIEDKISCCTTCQKHRNKHKKESIINHEIPDSP